MKSLLKTVSVIFIFTALTKLLGFVFRIYLSRTMGTEMLGLYQLSLSVFMVFLTIVSSGFPLIVSRQTAKYTAQKNVAKQHQVLSTAIVISTIFAIIISVVVLVFQFPISKIFADKRCMHSLFVLLPALVFSAIYSSVRGNLWGKNQYIASCSAELFEQAIRFIVCLILFSGIFSFSPLISASLSMSVACLFSCLYIVVVYLIKGGKFKRPNNIKGFLKQSTPITGIRVASSLIVPIISLIIPLQLIKCGYTHSQSISLFGIASGMTLPLLTIPLAVIGSLAYALVPDLSSAVAMNNKEHVTSRITLAFVFTLFVSFIMIPLFVGAGQNIGTFFFNNSTSGSLLSASAWIIVPWCFSNISSSILNSTGYEFKSFKNFVIGAVFMILSIYILPQFIGINALIFSMGICFLIVSILNYIMIKKYVFTNVKIAKYLIKFILFCVPCIAIVNFSTNILNNFIPLFFNLAISCSLGFGFYVLLCLIFNVFKFSLVVAEIKNQIKIKKEKQLLKKQKKVNAN